MSLPIIRVENLSKVYRIGVRDVVRDTLAAAAFDLLKSPWKNLQRLRRLNTFDSRHDGCDDALWALKDISFDVREGEVVGIVGCNGAGKSTLLKVLSRITEPTVGRIELRGRVSSLLEVGTGFHPELTGRENIYMNGTILGMTSREINQKFDEIVEFSGVERFLDTPIKRYSSGMQVRLAFAVAAHLDPEVLIIDEVLAVGDLEFQRKCLGKMGDVARSGRTVLFVSHNMSAVRQLCSTGMLIEHGRVVLRGSAGEVVEKYTSDREARAEVELPRHVSRDRPREYFNLLRLKIFDADGRATTSFVMGQPLFASIDIECKRPVNAEVGLKISSWHDVAIHYLNSSWEGLCCRLDPGRYRFVVEVPKLLLFPGRYQLGVWASQALQISDTKALGVTVIDVVKGDVTGHPTIIDKYASSGCEVHTPSRWMYEPLR